MDFTPIETQEALDALLSEREAAVRGEYADYDQLKTENQQYKLNDTRRRIGEEVGIPASLISRIAGSTEAEMRTDAKALLEALPKQPSPLRDPDSGSSNRDGLRKLLSNINF